MRLQKKTKKYRPPVRTYDPREHGADCENCPLYEKSIPIPATVAPQKVKLAIVGEAPGPIEESRYAYFAGPSGEKLNELLEENGIPRRKVHINNCLQCRPRTKMSVADWKKATACCWPRLEKELCQSGAKMILGLGKWSQWSLRGKTDPIHDWCGSPYPVSPPFRVGATGLSVSGAQSAKKHTTTRGQTGKTKTQEIEPSSVPSDTSAQSLSAQCITSYHPAFALRGKRVYLAVLSEHLGRAWRLATGSLKPWKWPTFYCKDDKKAVAALERMWRGVQNGKIKRLGIDIETNGVNPVTDAITKVGISSKEVAVSLSWPVRQDALRLVRSILAHPVAKAAHNGTHDLIGFEKAGIPVNGYEFDTIIQHAVWVPTLLHRLQFACCLEFGMPAWKKEYKVTADEKGKAYEPKTPEEWLGYGYYNAKDAYMTLVLSYALEKRLRREVDNWKELYDGYLARSLISKEMRKTGIRLDRVRLRKHLKSFMERRRRARSELRKFAAATKYPTELSTKLNPASAKQMRDFFFKHLRARPLRFSPKTGEGSLDERCLQNLSLHPNPRISRAAQIQIRYRRWGKLVDMTRRLYLGRAYKKTKKDKRQLRADLRRMRKITSHIIHADGQCWGTKTGRWAYRDPNLTTIPKPKLRKSADARRWILVAPGLRDSICSREGTYFVEVDYSQLELRVVGYLTGDRLLIQWYEEGQDVHTENAKRWFQTESPSKSQRNFAKTMVYAMNYGGSSKTIWQNLVVDYPGLYLSDIERYIKLWYMHHPAIRTWQAKLLAAAEDTGQVKIPISGKVVNLYGDRPDPPKVYNPPVQGTAAAIIDGAIMRVWPQVKRDEDEELLLQVHDALIGESPKPYRFATLLKTEMEEPVVLEGRKTVFPADVKIGTSWGECEEKSDEELKNGLAREMVA